jgi:N-acetyl-anhydromuramyl-L-alanine amidase AmpD
MELMNVDAQLQRYDVWSLGYKSKVVANTTSISEVMDRMADFLDANTEPYTHVVVISHSLGGVIGRGALGRSKFERRLHQRCTFITLGTPFDGSMLARYAELFPNIASDQVHALKAVDPNSEVLNGHWKRLRHNFASRLRHFAGYETRTIGGGVLVVDQKSASLSVAKELGDEAVGFDGNHFTICKFANANHSGFRTIKQWIVNPKSGFPSMANKLPSGARLKEGGVCVFEKTVTVEMDFDVPFGCTLEVLPGTTVLFRNGALILCEGMLQAHGSANEPIIFDFDQDSCREAALVMKGSFVEGSRLTHCEFRYGNGMAMERADPRRDEKNDPTTFWWTAIERSRGLYRLHYTRRAGGAVVLWNASKVGFENCQFYENEAWNGGACVILNSRLVGFRNCQFERNRSAFGGALYVLSSDLVLDSCTFEKNLAVGPANTNQVICYQGENQFHADMKAAFDSPAWSCGGALYLGYRSQVNIRNQTKFVANRATYVGGAIYNIETHPQGSPDASIIVGAEFTDNRAGFGGGAVWVDDSSRVHFTESTWLRNRVERGASNTPPVQALKDASSVVAGSIKESGLKLNGTTWYDSGSGEANDHQQIFALPANVEIQPRLVPPPTSNSKPAGGVKVSSPAAPFVDNEWMLNQNSFKTASGRAIDTIVIHHVSAIKWTNDTVLRTRYRERVEALEKRYPVAERKYDWRSCKEIFEIYGVSAHYMIDRGGKIRRLVREKDIAFHAGAARMPDGREGVNEFSLGIELISSHPKDDPEVESGKVPAYTEKQYESLLALIAEIRARHQVPSSNVIGHDQIAPGRKTDPGPLFDWGRVRKGLRSDASSPKPKPPNALAIVQFRSGPPSLFPPPP